MDACVLSDFDIRAVERSALVDIRDVKVNTALPKRERMQGIFQEKSVHPTDFVAMQANRYLSRRMGI